MTIIIKIEIVILVIDLKLSIKCSAKRIQNHRIKTYLNLTVSTAYLTN